MMSHLLDSCREDRLEECVDILFSMVCSDCFKCNSKDCVIREQVANAKKRNKEDGSSGASAELEKICKERGTKIFAKKATKCRKWEISEDEEGHFESIESAIRWVAEESDIE